MESIALNPKSIDVLIEQLKDSTGIEFKCYRRNFLERRIKGRMIRLGLTTDRSYLDYILSNPQEIDLLNSFCFGGKADQPIVKFKVLDEIEHPCLSFFHKIR